MFEIDSDFVSFVTKEVNYNYYKEILLGFKNGLSKLGITEVSEKSIAMENPPTQDQIDYLGCCIILAKECSTYPTRNKVSVFYLKEMVENGTAESWAKEILLASAKKNIYFSFHKNEFVSHSRAVAEKAFKDSSLSDSILSFSNLLYGDEEDYKNKNILDVQGFLKESI